MPSLALTDLSVRSLSAPEKGQRTYWDSMLKGFGVRVSQGGTKSFVVMHGRNRELTTLGRYPAIRLKDARSVAKTVLAEQTLGKHRPATVQFSEALERFLKEKEYQVRPVTYHGYKRLLEHHWKPRFGQVDLVDIRSKDIHQRLDKLTKSPSEQAHALTALKIFLNWCEKREYLERSPAVQISRRKTVARARVLDDAEVVAVWNGADTYPFGAMVRLMLLTGLRRGEAASLHWDDLKDEAVSIPGERTKNGHPHSFPRTPLVASILESLPRTHAAFLFPARGKDTPFTGWSKSKIALDKSIEVEPWTLHDLRRTAATRWASLGTPPHVVERLLNHRSGTVSGVAAIYNRFSYWDEMREALEGWEEELQNYLGRCD